MTPLSPEPGHTFTARWWRSISAMLSVLLIAGAVWYAGRESTDSLNQESRQRSLLTCGLQAQSRIEGNARYVVLRAFILAAVQAREDTAEATTSRAEARINRHAADDYRDLLKRIHPLPVPNCSEVIP